jgi:hypothetical protein
MLVDEAEECSFGRTLCAHEARDLVQRSYSGRTLYVDQQPEQESKNPLVGLYSIATMNHACLRETSCPTPALVGHVLI